MNTKKTSKLKIFTNGVLKENPVLRLMLGMCPTLAVTTSVFNGIGMGVATAFVLLCSNVVISLLRKIIPSQVRLPSYIVIIASFVTIVQMLIKAYVPALNDALGIYLPLITANCIILGRAEMFASKNKVGVSFLDGLGSGIGFILVLVVISAIRELLGAGTLLGVQILPAAIAPLTVILLPPGGFFVFACVMALVLFAEQKLTHQNSQDLADISCSTCPSAELCTDKGGNEL